MTIPPRVSSIGYSAFGWKLNAAGELYMDSSFVVHGYQGTIAQRYCVDTENENNFIFMALEEPAETEPAKTTKTGKTGKIIAVAVCAVLLAAVIAAAVLSELHRRRKNAEAEKAAKKAAKKAKRAAAALKKEAETEAENTAPDEGRESD